MIPYGSDRITAADSAAVESLGLAPGGYALVIARPEPENSVLPIVQALSMSAAMQEIPFASFGSVTIDGGDKALRQNAYRIRLTDDEDDKFFVWFRMV